MEVTTLKDFLELSGDGIDVCDSEIECPYCYMEKLDHINDNYDRFLDYIESNVKLEKYNPMSPVGRIVSVRYLDLLRENIGLWIEFTNAVNREEYQRDNYDSDEEFIEECLCYTLENMLNGGYSESDYTLFMSMVEQRS